MTWVRQIPNVYDDGLVQEVPYKYSSVAKLEAPASCRPQSRRGRRTPLPAQPLRLPAVRRARGAGQRRGRAPHSRSAMLRGPRPAGQPRRRRLLREWRPVRHRRRAERPTSRLAAGRGGPSGPSRDPVSLVEEGRQARLLRNLLNQRFRWSRRAVRPVTRPREAPGGRAGHGVSRRFAAQPPQPAVPLVEEGRQARHETSSAGRGGPSGPSRDPVRRQAVVPVTGFRDGCCATSSTSGSAGRGGQSPGRWWALR